MHTSQRLCASAGLAVAIAIGSGVVNNAGAGDGPKVALNERDFRDRVYACWLGKNIGGTLGMPVEGQPGPHQLTFYTNVGSGEPAANDDLDLQLLWLKALEENDARVDARILGQYWLKYVPVDWNEYGAGKRNMRLGLLPPVSGQFNNARWRHSNGAWCRTEIWAVLAPGCPALAVTMAREDACVDHGNGEGTLAAMFLTAVESAAFVERDREKLIAIGLSMIPPECAVARAIHTAQAAQQDGKDWAAARQEVIDATNETGWFQAPRDMAFTMLAWLYGEGDFSKTLCLAVNCGDDTDTSGAAIGALWGILHGTQGIPQQWLAPIGTAIKNVAISGFDPPRTVEVFTDRSVAMTRRVLALHDAPVMIADGPTDLSHVSELVLIDPTTASRLAGLSPYQVVWTEKDLQVTLDYREDPWIVPGGNRVLGVSVRNLSSETQQLHVALRNVPETWHAAGLPAAPATLGPTATVSFDLLLAMAGEESEPVRMTLEVADAATQIHVPVAFVGRASVGADDVALATKGATVRVDSEYDRETPCAAEAIDGIIATPDDFSNRWHSSLAVPHPHWIEVQLPKPERIGRVVIRFADPAGHPVDFHGLVRSPGSATWQEVFRCNDNQDLHVFRASFTPIRTDTFRLVISKSVNPVSLNAAQISEIELYPAQDAGQK